MMHTTAEGTTMRILISTLLALGLSPFAVLAQERIQVVSPTAPDGPMAYGISKLVEAISDRDITVTSIKTIEEADCSHVIVAGLASERPIATRITTCGLELPKQPEALTVGRIQDGNRCTVVLCGSDAVGLMYAALDTAERIGWATGDEDPFVAAVKQAFARRVDPDKLVTVIVGGERAR